MNKLSFKWVENKAQYQTGESLYLNRIRMGSYNWNGSRSKSDELGDSINWEGYVTLPSLADTSKKVYSDNADDIKTKVEQIITNWFKEALK